LYDDQEHPQLIKQLPLLLPYASNIRPTKDAISPLAGIKK
jgi:hypothetical protein